MKRILFAISIVAVFSIASCGGAKQETVNKMADELCEAMSLYDESNPMSSIEVASALTKIKNNVEEYGKVTDTQLMTAMEEKCPEGAALYKELIPEEE